MFCLPQGRLPQSRASPSYLVSDPVLLFSSFHLTMRREFDPTLPYPGNRGIAAGRHFLAAYGFDSQTANSLCFASYTYTGADNKVSNTMVQDHGFRALDDDP